MSISRHMPAVIVSGALANKPWNGGEAWVRMSWACGLRRLGCDVSFIEQIDSAQLRRQPDAVEYFRRVTRQFGFVEACALIRSDSDETIVGMNASRVTTVAREAALLVNISGHLTCPRVFEPVRRKAYVDIDPGFTQFWHAQCNAAANLAGHDCYFTIGENIGAADCPIPTGGFAWQPIRQPVVLEDWPVTNVPLANRFTTVASWRGAFGPVTHDGRTFGLKVHEFRKVIDLPRRAPGQTFAVALAIHPADARDRAALIDRGWEISDPRAEAADPDAFRRYVQCSGAEFSVAQGIYVDTNSGWFSDRTTRYLASGRPALVQETGFGRNIPTGEGLLAFRTLDEAVAGAEDIARDYPRHCRAARDLAAKYFDADRILPDMLRRAGAMG